MKKIFHYLLCLSSVVFLSVSAKADEWDISTALELANYVGSGWRYARYDVLILQNDIALDRSLSIAKEVTIKSAEGQNYSITVEGDQYVNIYAGGSLTLENVTFDGLNTSTFERGMFYLHDTNARGNRAATSNNYARLNLSAGATIQNFPIGTGSGSSDDIHAPITMERFSRLVMNEGSAILNCSNQTGLGCGGAIYCDSGMIVINGGTIAGCFAKNAGGAIFTTGGDTEVGFSKDASYSRGDIFIYDGVITNNQCGVGWTSEDSAAPDPVYGGGIYLGGEGPMMHVIGTVIISNNLCQAEGVTVADDVSTYLLKDEYAGRLKMSADERWDYLSLSNAWIGVRYPDVRTTAADAIAGQRFAQVSSNFGEDSEGYFPVTQEEARQFFWNGNNDYRGYLVETALIWHKHRIYILPRDSVTIHEIVSNSDEDEVHIQLEDDYTIQQNGLPIRAGLTMHIDLNGKTFTAAFHVQKGGQVIMKDTSAERLGRMVLKEGMTSSYDSTWSDVENPVAPFVLQGGTYQDAPATRWLATNCVSVANYDGTYTVTPLVWNALLEAGIADATTVTLDTTTPEIREVTLDAEGRDIANISYSTGDWVDGLATNSSRHVEVYAVAARKNTDSTIDEVGSRVLLFSTQTTRSQTTGDETYGREDTFVWDEASQTYGLIKLLHITKTVSGTVETEVNTEEAYFQFPEAAFEATQRADGSKRLKINLLDNLLAKLGYNRAEGFNVSQVNTRLDTENVNGLRTWESLVIGSETNHFRLATGMDVKVDNENKLQLRLLEQTQIPSGTGYSVRYRLQTSQNGTQWTTAGEAQEESNFTVDLQSGLYRIATLIQPDGETLVNEIPTTNAVGVVEVKSSLKNTLMAIPWMSLQTNLLSFAQTSVSVSNLLGLTSISSGDRLYAVQNDKVYLQWTWSDSVLAWEGATTVSEDGMQSAPAAGEFELPRTQAVWLARENPSGSFFLVGEWTPEKATLTIAGGTVAEPTCTIVTNPSWESLDINDAKWGWGSNPHKEDMIVVPSGNGLRTPLNWDAAQGKWYAVVVEAPTFIPQKVYKHTIPAGTGFWYYRAGDEWTIELP